MGDMFKNLAKGMGASGAGASINTGAIQRLQRQMAAKERMRTKLEEKAATKNNIEMTSDPTRAVFRLDDKQEYSSVSPPQPTPMSDQELINMMESGGPVAPTKHKKKSGKKAKK